MRKLRHERTLTLNGSHQGASESSEVPLHTPRRSPISSTLAFSTEEQSSQEDQNSPRMTGHPSTPLDRADSWEQESEDRHELQ